jgi:hypothetical protein
MGKEFIYQGRRYERFEDLPPEARQAYEQLYALSVDEDRDGIPDVLQGSEGREYTYHWGSARSLRGDQRLADLENIPTWGKKLVRVIARRLLKEMPPPLSLDAVDEDALTRSSWENAFTQSELSQSVTPTPLPYEDVSTSRYGLWILLVTLLCLLVGGAVALLFLT